MNNAKITATPCANGRPIGKKHVRTVETTDDLPADALGEVVSLALNSAWRSGYDPADPHFAFSVKVTFERLP
jgi:hypothetical protein